MNRIKELRRLKNPALTQQKLADLVGVARSTVAMWEAGKNEPDNDTLLKLAEIFNVSTDCVLGVPSENEHMATLNALYYDGIESWIHKGFFTTKEQTTLKMHFSELLLRYKQLIEGTSGIKRELKTYLKAIEPFNEKRDYPLSIQELADQFLKQELNKTIDSLRGWIDAFTLHFSRVIAAEDLAGKIPASAEGRESERWEVEEYRSRLLSEQPQPEQQKKPTPVTEDGLEEMFMRYVQELTPDQQRMILEQMQRMTGQQKEPSSVFAQQITGETTP